MGKISNYLEMIEDIKNKTPEKEAFVQETVLLHTGNCFFWLRKTEKVGKRRTKKGISISSRRSRH